VFVVLIIVQKDTSYSFTSNFNVSTLLDDASKPATQLTNGAINQTLRQFAPLSDYRLLQLVDCRESSTLIDRPLKNIAKRIIEQI